MWLKPLPAYGLFRLCEVLTCCFSLTGSASEGFLRSDVRYVHCAKPIYCVGKFPCHCRRLQAFSESRSACRRRVAWRARNSRTLSSAEEWFFRDLPCRSASRRDSFHPEYQGYQTRNLFMSYKHTVPYSYRYVKSLFTKYTGIP